MALNKNVAKGIKTRQENELLENNKLIAEFMEYPDLGTKGDFSYLNYHTSWDWLMPVVNKIRVPYNNTEVTGEKYEDIISVLAEGCVEANQLQVYEAVVEFIKCYNKKEEQLKFKKL
jgi:hypothetical protein